MGNRISKKSIVPKANQKVRTPTQKSPPYSQKKETEDYLPTNDFTTMIIVIGTLFNSNACPEDSQESNHSHGNHGNCT